jgi:hypothetical protein
MDYNKIVSEMANGTYQPEKYKPKPKPVEPVDLKPYTFEAQLRKSAPYAANALDAMHSKQAATQKAEEDYKSDPNYQNYLDSRPKSQGYDFVYGDINKYEPVEGKISYYNKSADKYENIGMDQVPYYNASTGEKYSHVGYSKPNWGGEPLEVYKAPDGSLFRVKKDDPSISKSTPEETSKRNQDRQKEFDTRNPIDRYSSVIMKNAMDTIGYPYKDAHLMPDNPDLGNPVSNFAAQGIGMGVGLAFNPGGAGSGSIMSTGNKVGQAMLGKNPIKPLIPLVNKLNGTTAGNIMLKAGQEAIAGGTMGALEGYNRKESPMDIAKRTGEYAAFGGVIGGGMGAVGAGFKGIKNGIKSIPETFGGNPYDGIAPRTIPKTPQMQGIEDITMRYNDKPFTQLQLPEGKRLSLPEPARQLPPVPLKVKNVSGKFRLPENVQKDLALDSLKPLKVADTSGQYNFKNTALEKSHKELEDAIIDIQNHFRTNQLRADEMARIKPELGIDVEKLLLNVEKAQSINPKNIAEQQRMKRVAGVASQRSYDVTDKIRSDAKTLKQNTQKSQLKLTEPQQVRAFINQDRIGQKLKVESSARNPEPIRPIEKNPYNVQEQFKREFPTRTTPAEINMVNNSAKIEPLPPPKLGTNAGKKWRGLRGFDEPTETGMEWHGLRGFEPPTSQAKASPKVDPRTYSTERITHRFADADLPPPVKNPRPLDRIPDTAIELESYINKIDDAIKKSSPDSKFVDIDGHKYLKVDLQIFGQKANAKLVNTSRYTRVDNTNIKRQQGMDDTTNQYNSVEDMPSTLDQTVSSYQKKPFSVKDFFSKVYTRTVDTFHPIKQADSATHKMATISNKAQGTANHILEENLVSRDGNNIGESFKTIFKDLPDIKSVNYKGESATMEELLNDYMLHKHNISRMNIKNTEISKALESDLVLLQKDQQLYKNLIETRKMELASSLVDDHFTIKNDLKDYKQQLKGIDKKINSLESKRGLAEMSQKPIFKEEFTPDMSKKVAEWYEQKHPELKKTAERLNKTYSTFMEEWAVKSGLLDKEAYGAMKKMYPDYVPTNRFFDELEKLTPKSSAGGSFVNKSGLVPKATGSTRKVINTIESMMKNIDKTVKAARSNEVGQILAESIRDGRIGKTKNGTPKAELTEAPQDMLDEINNSMREDGVEGLNDFVGSQFDRTIQKNLKGSNIITVMENGSPTFVKINDLELLRSLRGLTESSPGVTEKVGRAITKPFKTLVTGKNPIFALKNIARDIPTSYINSIQHNPLKFGKDIVKAAKEMTVNGKLWQEYKALGGEHGNFFSDGGKKLSKMKKQIVHGKNVGQKISDGLGKFNNDTESVNRFAEYIRTVEKGGGTYQSKLDGIYNAGEVSTNFGRHGDFTKAVDSFVPYLNPAVQGLDKFARQALLQPGKTVLRSLVRTAIKGGVGVTALTGILTAVNKDNTNYQQLDNRTKDTNFLFPIPGSKEFVKIPKARESGAILGALFERMYRQANGDKNAFKGFGNTLATNFVPPNPITDNYFSGITDLAANKDFANRDIVPRYMQDRSAKYQYDDNTSEISKWIGEAVSKLPGGTITGLEDGLSPKQIDGLVKSYLGIIAQVGIPVTSKGGNPIKAITSQFVADPTYSNQQTTDFYDIMDKLKKKATTKNFIENIPTKKVTAEEKLSSSFTQASTEMSDIRKKIKNTQDQAKVREFQEKINEIAKKMVDKYNNK